MMSADGTIATTHEPVSGEGALGNVTASPQLSAPIESPTPVKPDR
jgi:hypothetical protein